MLGLKLSPRQRRAARQFVGIAVVAVVTGTGALWYWLVEGFSLVDGVYQAVITVSTVGFAEIEELDTSGRIFTMVLIVVGVASLIYALGGFAEMLIESSIRRFTFRRRERTLERLSGHTVLCGYGSTGGTVARMLPADTKLGVIEKIPERVDQAAEDGHVAIEGDSTSDETLRAAGIERALRLIVCLSSDSDAISTVLSARVLNPDVLIVTRVDNYTAARKLRLAGADHVVSPTEMGAQRIVADALQPSVGTFLDVALHSGNIALSLRTITLDEEFDSSAISSLEAETGARVLGVQDHEGGIVEPRQTDGTVHGGQTLLVVGHEDELADLERHLGAQGR